MLFNSFAFLLFFPTVTLLYFVLPERLRVWMLLLASSLFYMWFIPGYILIIYFTIVVDYFAGRWIEHATGPRRKAFLILSLAANLGVLSVFKYANFLIGNLNTVLGAVGAAPRLPLWDIILPLGLSFHTFQAMSYTIEVYRGKQAVERDFPLYALYVLYYPQLVAGPIERPQNILHQLREPHSFDTMRVARGFRRMLLGFLKKSVVADRLAILVSVIYGAPHRFGGPILVLGTISFAFQIYADFSGYSDIALGASEVMGISLMNNFRQPYMSSSVSEFWGRWHISLSTWFRDYVYIPLGGNRVSVPRQYVNLMLTFLLCGLWHGASWTFVVWGGLNGLFLVLERLGSGGSRQRSPSLLGQLRTFVLVTLAWIFFRAATFRDAFAVLRGIPHGWSQILSPARDVAMIREVWIAPLRGFVATFMALGVLIVVDALASRRGKEPHELLGALPSPVRWATYYAAAATLLFVGQFGQQQFIYFQF